MCPYSPWVLSWRNLAVLPVAHYRLEFAELARRRFLLDTPDILALELPGYLAEAYIKAVRRLPEVSVLLYQHPAGTDSHRTHYLVIEPVDPFVECTRLALERGLPIHLVDIDLNEPYPPFRDPLPDPYALLRLGPEAFYRFFEVLDRARTAKHPLDLRREQGMAFHLRQIMREERKVLFLCGLLHGRGVLDCLGSPQARPLNPRRSPPVQVFHLHPECLDEVMATFPFLSAVYETRRTRLPPEPAAGRLTVRRRFDIGALPFRLLEQEGPLFDEPGALRESLLRVAHGASFRGEPEGVDPPIDRSRLQGLLFREARRHYREETGEGVRLWQTTTFWRFVRNYAWSEGLLVPDFFHLLVGARACVDDNFAFAFLRLGRFYPWQRESSEQPTVRLSGEDVWLGTRKLRVRRWFPHRKRVLPRPIRKDRKRQRRPGEWLESFDGATLCSYPPEDIVVEDYGARIREGWTGIIRDEQSDSEPFSSSLEDGVDIRETLRNWSERKIYVKRRRRAAGPAGSVVVVFDEDQADARYPYRMTWLGEHDQESDMAFYATAPEEHVVGPGICRCEYGGFLMTSPPRRLRDVWLDPDYLSYRSKSEKLLAAGLDYSMERWVVYAASKPPRSTMRSLAERLRRQIIYVPLGSLSAAKLKKIRIFHILSGHDKRALAREYVD